VFCSSGIKLSEKKKTVGLEESPTPPTATSCFVVVIEEASRKGVARENQPCGCVGSVYRLRHKYWRGPIEKPKISKNWLKFGSKFSILHEILAKF